MTEPRTMLLISPDPEVAKSVGRAVERLPNLRVRTEASTLAGLNGQAARLAGSHDLVVFQSNAEDGGEIPAIQALSASRRAGSIVVALADRDIPLSKVRALTEAGVDEVLPIPFPGAGFDFAQLAQAAAPGRTTSKPSAQLGTVIAVAQARGGAGATTVAVNLADQLAGVRRAFRKPETRRVALVDLDLQFGTVGTVLDLPEQDTLMQLALDGTVPDAHFLEQSMTILPSGVSVLTAPQHFTPLDSLRSDQVTAIIEALRLRFDYVVIDLPRAVVRWIEPVMHLADRVIVVTDTSVPSIRHCRRLIDLFTADNVALPVEVVVNRERRPILGVEAMREAARALERKIVHWLPDDPRCARAAADRGKPLSQVAPRAPLTRRIGRLAVSVRAAHPVNPSVGPTR